MKKILTNSLSTVVLCLIGYSQSVAQFTGDSFKQAQFSKKAKLVYLHAGVSGFASVDANGTASGLLVDIMKEFEDHLKDQHGIVATSQLVTIPRRDFKLYLEEVSRSNGGVFGLGNTTITVERKKFLQFSGPFLKNVSVLISHKSFHKLSALENIGNEFADKLAVGVPSTINHDRLLEAKEKYLNDMPIKTVKSSHLIMEEVSKNPKAYGFVNAHYYLEYLKMGKPIMRHPAGDEGGREFGVVMPLKSDWGPVFSTFLDEFKETSRFRELVIKNLGRDALRML